MMANHTPAPLAARFSLVQKRALILGIALLILALLDGIRAPEQFFRSYLLAYVFWLGFPLGCAAFLMVHHLTGGFWGLPIRRPLEAGARTMPLLVVLVLPLLLGLGRLYSWMHPDLVAADAVLKFKQPYLNLPFFLIRNIVYFLVWLGITGRLTRWSDAQDRTGDPRLAVRLEAMSGPGLVLYGLTVTFFSIDWLMSLEPHWFSTIYGMIFMVLQVLSALALVIFVVGLLSSREPVVQAITPDRFNDLGNLVLTFVMLWAYLSFSQFLIIWAGDLDKEIPWYLTRASGGWAGIALVMIFVSFAIPFYLLLMRAIKRRVETLSILCGALVVVNFVDVYWMVVPAFHPSPRFYLLDFLLPVGIGSIWVADFVRQLKSRPLLPLHDPRFEGALEHGD